MADEESLSTLDDILNYEPDVATEVVSIGRLKVKVQGITDPTVLTSIIQIGRARKGIPIQVNGQPIRIDPTETDYYTWLENGLVEPKLDFSQIVALSKKTGFDCVAAATRVMVLSEASSSAVDVAKNAFGEETE